MTAPPGRAFAVGQPAAGGEQGQDRGSASVWTLSLVLVIVTVGTAGLAVAGLLRAHARAVTAADLGALAAARAVQAGDQHRAACAAAGRIAASNGARLISCIVTGEIVDVVAEVRVPGVGGRAGPARAAARAGPVDYASVPGR